MICPVCGANNPMGVSICTACGAPMQQGFQQGNPTPQYGGPQSVYGGSLGIKKRSIVTAVILTIITCGIYGLYWFVQLNDDSNKLSGESGQSGITVLLLSLITCGIYFFIWSHKRGEIIDRWNASNGLPGSNNSVTYLILSIFGLGIVTYCLLQNELNKVAD